MDGPNDSNSYKVTKSATDDRRLQGLRTATRASHPGSEYEISDQLGPTWCWHTGEGAGSRRGSAALTVLKLGETAGMRHGFPEADASCAAWFYSRK